MGISASQERYVNFYTDFAFKKLFGTEVNKELLHDYRESQKDLWDLNSVLETAENKGIKKVAKKMLEKGYPIDDIMQLTGLNEEEISSLI